jgi:O-antigen/teichoic acid export membrane protein
LARGGLSALIAGSLVGSAVAALVSLIASWPRTPPRGIRLVDLAQLFRIGRARTGVQLLETLRPVVLLQILTLRGGGDAGTALLYGGMLFTLPLVAVPERIAQAVYPTMVGSDGETPDLDAQSRRLTFEIVCVAVPLLGLVGLALTFLLPLLRDGAYAGSVASALIMHVGVAAQRESAHLGYQALVRHRLHWDALVSLAALVLMSVLAWQLVPIWGAAGAATALSAALIARAALLAAATRAGGTPHATD